VPEEGEENDDRKGDTQQPKQNSTTETHESSSERLLKWTDYRTLQNTPMGAKFHAASEMSAHSFGK
jgi:hypothetical protein